MLCMKKEVSLLYNFSLCVAPAPKEIVLASQELRENVKYNLTGGEVVYVSLPCPSPLPSFLSSTFVLLSTMAC